MLEFKKYKLFIYKNNQFIRAKPVVLKNKDTILDFQKYRPYVIKETDGKILQTNSSQNLYTIDKELLLYQ